MYLVPFHNNWIFWMNSQIIIGLGFRMIWRIIKIEEHILSHDGRNTRWITHSQIYIEMILIVANYHLET